MNCYADAATASAMLLLLLRHRVLLQLLLRSLTLMVVLLALHYWQPSLCVCCYCIFRKCELLRRSCHCNCYAVIATPTSSFDTVALSLVRVPGQTATLPLLLLTSFATIASAIPYGDASVARVAVLTAVIVRMLLLHIQKV